jgi:hypothetical protein
MNVSSTFSQDYYSQKYEQSMGNEEEKGFLMEGRGDCQTTPCTRTYCFAAYGRW